MGSIPERIDSKFRFVLLAANRAEQLMRGARPQVEGTDTKVARTAMREIEAETIVWDYGPAPEPEAADDAEASEESEDGEGSSADAVN